MDRHTPARIFFGALILQIAAWVLFLNQQLIFALTIWLVSIAALLYLGVKGIWANPRDSARSKQRDSNSDDGMLQNLADGLETAVFICSHEGEVQYANRSARSLFGVEQPVGQTILAVTLTHTIQTMIRRALDRKERQVDELSLRSGELTALVQVWLGSTLPQRVFVSIYDVSKLKRLERVRRDFVANVSHELRTPLTTIRAMAEILRDTEPDDEKLRAKYLAQIEREVDRLTNIVNDLLTLSTAESMEVDFEPLDLSEIAEEVTHKLAAKAMHKGIALKTALAKPASILGNPTQVNQILLNLIDNAINYTPQGHVMVAVRLEPEVVVLEVTDTGMGIAVEHIDRIFERFYRVDKGRSREGGGTGLGLSIVRHLVEAHRGTIHVESFLNRGSSFTVRFPLGVQRDVPPESNAGSKVLDA